MDYSHKLVPTLSSGADTLLWPHPPCAHSLNVTTSERNERDFLRIFANILDIDNTVSLFIAYHVDICAIRYVPLPIPVTGCGSYFDPSVGIAVCYLVVIGNGGSDGSTLTS